MSKLQFETQLRLTELYNIRDTEPTRFKKDRLNEELAYLRGIYLQLQRLKTLEAIQAKLREE